jgi:hypothetical protein
VYLSKIRVLINYLNKNRRNYYMNQKRKALINEYRDYLVMLNIKTTEVNMSIKTIEDINRYKEECINNLNDLEKLNKEIKLYEKDYDNFRISMGKFAMGLSKFHKLKLSEKEKENLNNIFIELSEKFEELMQKNIIKDVYIWI